MNTNEQALAAMNRIREKVQKVINMKDIRPLINIEGDYAEVEKALESGGAEGGEDLREAFLECVDGYSDSNGVDLRELLDNEIADNAGKILASRLTQTPQVPVSGYSREQMAHSFHAGRESMGNTNRPDKQFVAFIDTISPPAKIAATGVVVHGYLRCSARQPGDTTAMVGQESIINCPTCIEAHRKETSPAVPEKPGVVSDDQAKDWFEAWFADFQKEKKLYGTTQKELLYTGFMVRHALNTPSPTGQTGNAGVE